MERLQYMGAPSICEVLEAMEDTCKVHGLQGGVQMDKKAFKERNMEVNGAGGGESQKAWCEEVKNGVIGVEVFVGVA